MIATAVQARYHTCAKRADDVTRSADYRLHWQNNANQWNIIECAIVSAQIDSNAGRDAFSMLRTLEAKLAKPSNNLNMETESYLTDVSGAIERITGEELK